MKSGEVLAAKIIDIDRQHTPTARLCSPRAIRSRKSEAWFHKLKECIRFISKISSYLGFRWLMPLPLNIDPQNDSMENMIHFLFSVLGGFFNIFKNRRHALISFNPLLVSHFVFEPHLELLEKTTPTFKKAFVWLKVEIESHIFLIYFARSKILSLRDHITLVMCICVRGMNVLLSGV